MPGIQETLNNMNDDFISYLILALISVLLIVFVSYIVYMRGLKSRECNFMDTLYPSLNGYIRPLNPNDSDCSGALCDYYIKSAFNACSGGSYKNDFVDLCNLKSILKEGVRGLDFQIYSINNDPVVSTSTVDDYYIKETFNHVKFADVMNTIRNYAFASGSAPNPTDPIIIHLRFMSKNQKMYSNLAKIFESNSDIMLGKEYSYEYSGKNLGSVPLLNFRNKIVLIVDKTNNSYMENEDLMEYINMTSSCIFMRKYEYYDVKNNPDINELQEYNKKNMSIVIPDKGSNPPNPSGILCREAGCQMVALRYQYVDSFLAENNNFFNNCAYAFCLKPARLRYQEITIAEPTPQKPEYSYATKEASTDYYSFKF
jgi:hypothetical protein